MSSTQEGSSGVGVSSKKTERNRRSWTLKEEATLLTGLKELVANGLKSDNGFRAGYLNKLEAALLKEFPSTDLRAMPHINSKLTSWKKSYYSLRGILSRSGVGFNLTGNHMIDCEDEQWEQIIKADPNARLLRNKRWRYYDDWMEVFGKDRATGENAEDIFEAWTDLRRDEEQFPEGMTPGDKEFSSDNDVNEIPDANDRFSQSDKDGIMPRQKGKKRKISDDLGLVCELLSEMNQSTNSRLEHLANRIGYEFDMGKARQETFDQLGEIPGLSLENRFIVCELVAFKAERLDIWRGMKPEARALYVDHLLKIRPA